MASQDLAEPLDILVSLEYPDTVASRACLDLADLAAFLVSLGSQVSLVIRVSVAFPDIQDLAESLVTQDFLELADTLDLVVLVDIVASVEYLDIVASRVFQDSQDLAV